MTPVWRRLWPGTVTFVLGLAALVVVVVSDATPPCSEILPCVPSPAGALVIGLLLALPFVGFVHRWVAPLSGAVALVAIAVHSAPYPGDGTAAAAYVVLGVFTLATAVIAWRVPASPLPARPPRGAYAFASAVVFAAVVLVGLSYWLQAMADERMRSAEVVQAIVVGHRNDVTIWVDHAGQTVDIGVQDAAAYPVGSPVAVALDSAGLHQLVYEPYDATSWNIIAAFLLALGGAVLWRLLEAARMPRAAPAGAARETDATGWPVMRWYEIATITTIIMLGVCGGIAGARTVIGTLSDALCSGDFCSGAVMTVAGWASIAVPIFALAGVYRLVPRSAGGAMAVAAGFAVFVFAVGLVVSSSGDDASVPIQHPQTLALLPGAYTAIFGLMVGATIARGQTPEELGRGRGLAIMSLAVLAALPVTLVIIAFH